MVNINRKNETKNGRGPNFEFVNTYKKSKIKPEDGRVTGMQ